MRIGFWGVRGSLPAPRQGTWRYGGNTPCLEILADNQIIILDAGSGIQALGDSLTARLGGRGLSAHLLFTHYHWDHIQGLPFFAPLFAPGTVLRIFGPRPGDGRELRAVLRELFTPPFFPVGYESLRARQHVVELPEEGELLVGAVRIRTCPLNHPQGAVAYRFDHEGASFVYATDHEPGDRVYDNALRQLATGADVLIADAQYLPGELGQKAGWGHGSWKHATELARSAGVGRLFLFHHDPARADWEIDEMVDQAGRDFADTWAAAEGMVLELAYRRFQMVSYGASLGPATDRTGAGAERPIPGEYGSDSGWPGAMMRAGERPTSTRSVGMGEPMERELFPRFPAAAKGPEGVPGLAEAFGVSDLKGMMGLLVRWELQGGGRNRLLHELRGYVDEIEFGGARY